MSLGPLFHGDGVKRTAAILRPAQLLTDGTSHQSSGRPENWSPGNGGRRLIGTRSPGNPGTLGVAGKRQGLRG